MNNLVSFQLSGCRLTVTNMSPNLIIAVNKSSI